MVSAGNKVLEFYAANIKVKIIEEFPEKRKCKIRKKLYKNLKSINQKANLIKSCFWIQFVLNYLVMSSILTPPSNLSRDR